MASSSLVQKSNDVPGLFLERVMIKIFLIFAIFFFVSGNPLSAQDSPAPSIYTQQYDYTSVYLLPQKFNARPDSSPQTIYNNSSPSASPKSLNFTPSMAQRKKNVADYVAHVAKIAPDYAPQLASEFTNGAVFDQYGQMLESVGLDTNNVGDNLAVWWISAWEASMARPVATPNAAYVNVSGQARRVLASDSFSKMSNADKQKFADSLMIQSLILANQIDQAKGNPDVAKKLAIGIKQGAKKLGFDLESMTLTEDGFKPLSKKRSDTSDVLKGK
jgi:hypothetical protein